MKRLLIFICLQTITLALFGQNDYLQLSRISNPQHIKKIPEGKLIRIKPISHGIKTMKGKLEILNDSVIALGGDTILINNIKKIWVRNTSSFIIGGVAIVAGLGGFIMGIDMVQGLLPLDPDPAIAFFETIGIVIGVGLLGSGFGLVACGIYILASGINYITYGRSGYSIRIAHNQTAIPSGINMANLQQKL